MSDTGQDKPWRSHSQLTTFIECGEQYRLARLEKAEQRPAAWFQMGTATHAGIERWEKSDRGLTVAEAVTISVDTYDKEIAEERERQPDLRKWLTGGRVKPEDDIERRREKVALYTQQYCEWALGQKWELWRLPDDSPAVEVPFLLELETVYVRGFIDQIIEYPDGTLAVQDLKAGSVTPKTSWQLGVYAMALESLFGIRPRYGCFYMAKDNDQTVLAPLEVYTLEFLSDLYGKMNDGVMRGNFLPHVGDHCRRCVVQDSCKIPR